MDTLGKSATPTTTTAAAVTATTTITAATTTTTITAATITTTTAAATPTTIQQHQQLQQQQQQHQQETKPANERGQGVMQYLLPQELIQSKRKLLVMDLDETMVFSTFEEMKNPDFVIDGMSKSGRVKTKVKVRPFLRRFLSECSKKYDIVVFTASGAPYANYVLDKIDVDCVIAHRLFGDSLTKFGDGKYIKDLGRLGKPLEKVIIVDDMPSSYAGQFNNAVPIGKFKGAADDQQVQFQTKKYFIFLFMLFILMLQTNKQKMNT
ncbi:hypothetical protein RFI_30297 [Reticulomyxa filosa]|uniref:Mitochondrial import inner membrane translocase subunit TIM50 n=1 Tax=Reticulomyxa filosa TaxID=46433 RepID=X6M280_RETFI|nr:hypothetical protein RFI_30297 [Reticulomyxa filosa]|eukprot:ETO07095.1 hypothetical protein RFI_30297 [Reticulomyxa filosa]